MSGTLLGGDVHGFYAALGIELPDTTGRDVSVRCFANPDAHAQEDRRPSCSVNLESGAWRCWACGAYDAAIARGLSPREAMDLLIAHGLAERRARRGGRFGAGERSSPSPAAGGQEPLPLPAAHPASDKPHGRFSDIDPDCH